MLSSPLYFISYISWRIEFRHKIEARDEYTAFGLYLNRDVDVANTFTNPELPSTKACDLEAAILVQREGFPGQSVPRGILTNLDNTVLKEVIQEMERNPLRFPVGLGAALLEFPKDLLDGLCDSILALIHHARKIGRMHSMVVHMEHRDADLTIHVNDEPFDETLERMKSDMLYGKHPWPVGIRFGLVIAPKTGMPLMGFEIKGQPATPSNNDATLSGDIVCDVDENSLCVCGSGEKYKECCGLSPV